MSATLTFNLNGEDIVIEDVDLLAPLANTIREKTGMTGTKVACGQGNCGACTVAVKYPDDESESWHVVNSCLFPTGGLVAPVGGHISVRTVEGVTAKNEEGAPIFPKAEATGKAIAESNGSQCGFCTPGMVMKAASNCFASDPKKEIHDIEDLLDGNLCRCTGYRPILYALKKEFGKLDLHGKHEDERVRYEIEETPACVVRGKGASYSNYRYEEQLNLTVDFPFDTPSDISFDQQNIFQWRLTK
jgi:xanthine dehydrogenase iron-sulfur cluster and FAD-binding subunit A